MNVLISGAGIAGLTFALCLQRRGHRPVVIDRSPGLRGGGYMIDFYGPGYDAAENLGLLPELAAIHYPIPYLSFVDPAGRQKFALAYPALRKLFNNRHFNFMRGDLEQVLYEEVNGKVEIRFGTTLASCVDAGEHVLAGLSDGSSGEYDLLAGADGIHSLTRKMVFGEEDRFIHFMGYYTAAFIIPAANGLNLRPDAFQTLTEPGRQVAVYPIRGGGVATFFIYRATALLADPSQATARRELRRVFGDMDWIVPKLLAFGEASNDIYFDSVSQVEMPEWHAGRVVLAGDACGSVSLVAGQGASMAMAGAYVLAEELAGGQTNILAALARYEKRVKPAVLERQASARSMARWFVPASRTGLAVRDLITRSATWPGVSRLVRRTLTIGGKL